MRQKEEDGQFLIEMRTGDYRVLNSLKREEDGNALTKGYYLFCFGINQHIRLF